MLYGILLLLTARPTDWPIVRLVESGDEGWESWLVGCEGGLVLLGRAGGSDIGFRQLRHKEEVDKMVQEGIRSGP